MTMYLRPNVFEYLSSNVTDTRIILDIHIIYEYLVIKYILGHF